MGRLESKLRLPLIVLAALACLATPATRYERNYPAWTFDQVKAPETTQALGFGCAQVLVWISKSGKQGMGVSFEIENRVPDPCEVAFVYASLLAGDQVVKPSALPAPVSLKDEDRADAYMGFQFDNEALWNEGKRTGMLNLTLKVQGEVKEYHLPLTDVLEGGDVQRLRNPNTRPPPPETRI